MNYQKVPLLNYKFSDTCFVTCRGGGNNYVGSCIFITTCILYQPKQERYFGGIYFFSCSECNCQGGLFPYMECTREDLLFLLRTFLFPEKLLFSNWFCVHTVHLVIHIGFRFGRLFFQANINIILLA